jgi:hypothetical protein
MKNIVQIFTMMHETQLDTKKSQIVTIFCVHHSMQTLVGTKLFVAHMFEAKCLDHPN